MNLYNLTEKYAILEQMFDNPDIDEQTILDTMESLNGDIQEKAENYAYMIRNFEGDILALKNEEQRLAGRRKALENNISRMKKDLQQAMITTNNKKFKTAKFSFNVQKNPPSVDILDQSLIADDYLVTSISVDRKSILAKLKQGEKINGVELKISESLRIR